MLQAIRLGTVLLLVALTAPAVVETLRGSTGKPLIPTVSPLDVAERVAQGERVVFVDVREPAEFREFHLPGALSMPLRSLYRGDLSELDDADLVIPYCLKDFRGFEGARALADRGVQNVATFEGYGVRAWQRAGLPVAGTFNGTSDDAALESLRSGAWPSAR